MGNEWCIATQKNSIFTWTRVPSKLNFAVSPFPSSASSKEQISSPVSQFMMQMCSSCPLLMNWVPKGDMDTQRTEPLWMGRTWGCGWGWGMGWGWEWG